jgi:hypothetical protein
VGPVAVAFVLALAPNEPALAHGGYVHVAPGLIGFVPVADAALTTWTLGLDAGWHFRRRRGFTGQLGALFDAQLLIGDPREYQLMAGPQLRLGGTVSRRPEVFVYGHLAGGPVISQFGYGAWVGAGATIGPGAQFVFARHFTVGVEPSIAIGGEAWVQLRARVFIGARF